MDKKAAEVPHEEEIHEFTMLLETSPSVEVNEEKQRVITYGNFESLLRHKASSRIQAIIPAATLFAQSVSDLDECGRLGTDLIVNFVTMKSTLWRHRIKLTRYDLDCTGNLNREQLAAYLQLEIVPCIESFRFLEKNLLDDYQRTVLLMFEFFLDSKRTGRYRIADILSSGFIENIFALQDLLDSYDESGRLPISMGESWFSPDRTQNVLTSFNNYDKSGKGYLTREDFIEREEGGFTSTFVDRLFQVHVKRHGKMMSPSEFITFEIAHDHMQHPSAIAYFFKVLDLKDSGYLTRFDLMYFYEDLRSSYDAYFMGGELMPCFDDYFDQLYDMAQPETWGRISLKDLLRCKQAHDFINCLINFFEFNRFETREEGVEDSVMQDEEEEVEGERLGGMWEVLSTQVSGLVLNS